MFPCWGFSDGYGWIFPAVMIGVMVLCFFLMRGRAGSMMCGHGGRGKDGRVEGEGSGEKKRTITS